MRPPSILALCLAAALSGCDAWPGSWPASSSASSDQLPFLGLLSPASGNGTTQTFTASYSHPQGADKIIKAWLLVENDIIGINSCFLEYDSTSNTLNLARDDGTWPTPLAASSSGSLANTQCSVNAPATRTTTSGNTVTVTWPVTFTSAYAGPRKVWLRAWTAKVGTPWVVKGHWTVR